MSDQNINETYQGSRIPPKPSSGKKFLRILFILALVVIVIIYGPKVYSKVFKSSMPNAVLTHGLVDDTELYLAELKNIPSDISGMSQYDKIEIGLNPEDGSDTDGDGVSDKDEIEIYNSDPLKKSTAGDLYSDRYKIENGLDVNAPIEYKEKQIFRGNSCEEISLSAKSFDDFYAVVTDVTGEMFLEDKQVYKAWKVYNFSGELEIDLTSILSENEITMDDIVIYDGNWSKNEAKKAKYKVEGNKVIFNKAIESDTHIFYVAKKELINSKVSIIFGRVEYPAAMVVYNIKSLFRVSSPPHIYVKYVSDEMKMQAVLDELIPKVNDMIEYQCAYRFPGSLYEKDEDGKYIIDGENITIKYQDAFDMLHDKLTNGLSFFKMTESDIDPDFKFRNLFFGFFTYDYNTKSYSTYMRAGEIEQGTTYNTGFDSVNDRVPFENFKSEISPRGNCAGIATMTAKLFNKGYAVAEGSYYIDGYAKNEEETGSEVSWNLGIDKANYTLTDMFLSDFKTYRWVHDNAENHDYFDLNSDKLTPGEKEFIKMIGCYWREYNDYSSEAPVRYENETWYNYSMIDNICAKLDGHKILTLGIIERNGNEEGSGHAVNIVGYENRTENGVTFKIYDNNTRVNQPYTNGDLIIQKKIFPPDPENPEAPVKEPGFEYIYSPNEKSFKACNSDAPKEIEKRCRLYKFAVFDEDFNLITE